MRNFVDFGSERSILKSFLFLIICLLFSIPSKAQYSFSALKGTFTPLTDSKPVSSIQKYSSISGTIDIGFTFKFNGHPYDRIKASASGFITFKKFATWDGMDSSVIAPLGFNALSGEKGNASYKTEGIAPTRVFTFEWLNWKWDWDAARPGISFQVKLYETTNRIEFIYRQEAGELNKPFARIGLMFQQAGRSIFLSDAGENPKAYSNVSYYVYQKPATGQIYRFDELILSEPSNHITNLINSGVGSIALKWNDSKGEILPERYLIMVSDKSFEDTGIPVDGKEIEKDLNLKDGNGAVYVDYGVQNFSGFSELKVNSTYFFKVYPLNNYFSYTNYKTDGGVAELKVNTSIDLSTITVNLEESLLHNTSNDIQYSINSVDGRNGNWINCDPVKTFVEFKTGGYDLWVRQTSNPSNNLKLFYIPIQAKAPEFSINYVLSTTAEVIPETYEYSLNEGMSSSNYTGKGEPVELFPGSVVYFRMKASQTLLPSAIQTLVVPARSAPPSFSIDYYSEKTLQSVPESVEYSLSVEMKNVLSGNGEAISVVPGQKLYFRVKSTSTSFSSEIQTLSVSGRPSAPMFAIDFGSETTSQNITRDYEFSYSPSMSNPITGNGTPLVLEPGKDLYICQKANSYSFRSNIQHLAVPARPQAPINLRVDDDVNLFDWDFAMGFNKFSDYEYSIDNGSTWNLCSTKPLSVGNINVNPGVLKLRVKATSTTFKGDLASSDKAFTIKTGIPSLADAGIGLHPNPGKDFLFLDNLPKNSVLMILNSNGTIMIQKKFENSQVAIPIGGWPGDLFIIQVTTSRGQYQSKFVKL